MKMGIGSVFRKIFGKKQDFDTGERGTEGIGKKASDNQSGINYFRYSYNGSIGGDSFSYELTENGGQYVFRYESMEHSEFGEMEMPAGDDIAEKLHGLYLSLRLAEWDGFSKHNVYVLDGSGFSLSIGFRDGGRMRAGGENAFPDRYSAFRGGMAEILDPLRDELLERGRQKIIAGGVKGNVDFIMAYFKQQGSSGSDSYQFMLSKRGVRSKNFDITVKSRGGLFPAGEHRIYRDVPDEYVPFDGIQRLIEKYGLINWYGFDRSDPDYSNREWFQLNIGLDSGMYINAMGTAYPENYEAFRRDFLRLMADSTAALPDEETGARI